MLVKIGPYKNWFGPYQLAEKLMFWIPKEKDEHGFSHTADRVHRFGEWLAHGSIEPERGIGEIFDRDRPNTWLYRFLLWIDKKKKRKIYVRIDRWDTWSMGDTLAHIILPMLKQLNATKHGAPFVDDADVPEHLRSTAAPPKEDEYDTDANHFKRWDWVIEEMIFAFETKAGSLQDWEDQFTSGDYDFRFKKISEDGTSQMVEGPNHTAKTDWEGRKAYAQRIQNGFMLFGKYYESLWD
jgi:hypothetical protein